MTDSKVYIVLVKGRTSKGDWEVVTSDGKNKELSHEQAWLMVNEETKWTIKSTGDLSVRNGKLVIEVLWKGWPNHPTIEPIGKIVNYKKK